ncbi:MAG: YopX family protein [Ruminiclostridium sp.]
MRDILFRGKRTDNGAWTSGYLFCVWERAYLCWGTINNVPVMKEVIPETVGQYTGLKDKNGKKIFEGDIVRATIERSDGCQSPRTENGVIGYDCIGMIGLILYKDKNGENVWSDFFNELSMSGLIEDYYFEVIGNIYDNPELEVTND